LTFDLNSYLARIRWDGPREATFDTVAGILRGHMTHIPFENLDVLLGRGIRIDPDSVYAKLVAARRGGYCFEQSTLFEAALAAIRAAWTKPDQTPVAESSSNGSAASHSTSHSDVPLVREVENTTTRSVNGRGTAAPDRRQMPDEWGMFDAEKCGFPALVEKLDEVAESKDTTQRRSGTSTVISIR